jgi:hypothetical protein
MVALADLNEVSMTGIGLATLSFEKRQALWELAGKSLSSDKALGFDNKALKKWHQALYRMQRNQAVMAVKQERLKSFISAGIPYMNEGELRYWHAAVSEAYLLSLLNYNSMRLLDRKQQIKSALDDVNGCKKQLRLLDTRLNSDGPDYQAGPFLSLGNEDWSPVYYMGFELGKWYQKQVDDILLAPNMATRDWASELNWHRLYWVWSGGNGGLLSCLYSLDLFAGSSQANNRLEAPTSALGYASWILYFFRFSLEFSLLLKHTIPNQWMSEGERATPWQERFKTQWHQRKYILANDLVWGIVNLVTLYWLTSAVSSTMGVAGALLTVGLMMFDVTMAYLELAEEQCKFENEKINLQVKIKSLKEDKTIDSTLKQTKLIALQEELRLLKFEWQYSQKKLNLNTYCSITFIPAMVLMFAPVLFAGVLTAPLCGTLMLIGALGSVIITAAQSGVELQYDIKKASVTLESIDNKMSSLKQRFQNLQQKATRLQPSAELLSDDEVNELRLIHLEYKRLSAEKQYQSALKTFHSYKQINTVANQLLFPAVIFFALLTPALPVAIGLITAFVMLALVSRVWIKSYEPTPVNADEIALTKEEHDNPLTADLYHLPDDSLLEVGADSTMLQQEDNVPVKEPTQSLVRYSLFAHPVMGVPKMPKQAEIGFTPAPL